MIRIIETLQYWMACLLSVLDFEAEYIEIEDCDEEYECEDCPLRTDCDFIFEDELPEEEGDPDDGDLYIALPLDEVLPADDS